MMHTDGTNVNRKVQQGVETRAALLAAGRRLFGGQGYADTSTEDLAAAAGVTKGALYHHFSGKDDVFRAVYEQVKQQITEDVAPSFMQRDPWDALVGGCMATLDAYLDAEVRRIVMSDGRSVLGWEAVRDVEARYGAIAEACELIGDADDPKAARTEIGGVVVRLLDGLKPRA
jgi:AcrR family transcriptional regulator